MVATDGETGRGYGKAKSFYVPGNVWKKGTERPNVGVSIGSRNGASSRKGCVVNRLMPINKASNK